MQLQKVFTRSYADYLQRHISIEAYQQQEFSYDHSKVRPLANIYQAEGLLDELDPEDDFVSAIKLYEAYKMVTPLLATMPDLWIYLAHVDLFPYMQQRRAEVMNPDCDPNYIVRHWFKNEVSVLRMTLPGFWWSVHLSIDVERSNPYELTEILFKNQELRTTSFGPLPLIRHKEAMKGILEFFKENPELIKEGSGVNMRARYIQKLFKNLGEYKNLAYMDKNFFKTELYKRIETLSRTFSKDDIVTDKTLFSDTIR